ncbi:hypothetical protein EV132_1151 [Rhizobium sullae]|uniref:Uncharacterized protein n=1 Tax=Rhizobium sullae TaxID=50338 RepID=A0A4V2V8B3_RHISU|nr:hypothetical protein EV132_1151 [Rhizobium sullae]
MFKGFLTQRDPKFDPFFTSTTNGRRAAKAFLGRLKERKADRDEGPHPVPSCGTLFRTCRRRDYSPA